LNKALKAAAPLVAIIGIIALEVYAISQNINGTSLSIAIALIAGLGGYEAKALLKP